MSTELFVVDPDDSSPTPIQVRRKIAKTFRDLARLTDSGHGFTAGDEPRAAIRAAMVVVFSSDGEPTPVLIGFDKGTEVEFLQTAHSALWLAARRFIPGGLVRSYKKRTGADEMTSIYQGIREDWLRGEETRERYQQREAAERAEHERSHPFLCDCGTRTKTAVGLTQHQRGGPHRRWADRNPS